MSVPSMDDLLKTFVDTIDGAFCPDDFRRGLLAVLDRLKPVLEEAFVKGFLVSGEGYNGEYPHEFTDGETLRKELLAPSSEFITRIIDKIKGA